MENNIIECVENEILVDKMVKSYKKVDIKFAECY